MASEAVKDIFGDFDDVAMTSVIENFDDFAEEITPIISLTLSLLKMSPPANLSCRLLMILNC